MDTNLINNAISSALKCNWDDAIKINKLILKSNPDDCDALNRLAKALLESGNLLGAKKTSLKVIDFDSSNKIAIKALEKYKSIKKNSDPIVKTFIKASDFLEETGKTIQTNLLNLCNDDIVFCLDSGDEVFLVTHSHRVTVNTSDNKYLGKLPDDLSHRIKDLTKKGYEYRVIIKSSDKLNVKIFIKEIKRGKGFENQKSFPNEPLESFGELVS